MFSFELIRVRYSVGLFIRNSIHSARRRESGAFRCSPTSIRTTILFSTGRNCLDFVEKSKAFGDLVILVKLRRHKDSLS